MLYWYKYVYKHPVEMIKIGIDAMGGDNAPEVVVKGAIKALSYLGTDCRLVLYGHKPSIETILDQQGIGADIFDIVHTPDQINMGDNPAESFISKQESSIVKAFNHLAEGRIDALASAGSTGAMMVGAKMIIKPLSGVLRPTIALSVPTTSGSKVTILDIGINIDCKPEVLEQYAVIGSLYARKVIGMDSPRVALLNIGEESGKGNAQAKAAYALLSEGDKQGKYNFVGNIEASHIFTGERADVVVCDGFVGNTIIKLIEGLHKINTSNNLTDNFWRGMDYEQIGGIPILGINAPVTVAHGKSTPEAIKNMIISTHDTVKSGLINQLKKSFQD